MKLRTVAFFGVGYVLGSRAGRERYAQLVALAQKASVRLDEYSGARGQSAGSGSGQSAQRNT